MSDFYQKNMPQIIEATTELEQKVGHLKGAALISKLHKLVDKIQENVDINPKIQCGKQECSYCCHSLIALAPVEAEYIRANATYEIDENLQKKQRNTDYSKLSFMDKKCIMLKNGKCQIYTHRPILCRNHNIALGEDPLDCLKQNSIPGGAYTSEVKVIMNEAINFYTIQKSLNNPFKNIADYDWEQVK